MTTWSEAFTAFLKAKKLNQQQAMVQMHVAGIPVTQSQVSYWCHGAFPRESTRKLIQRWSRGKVRADLPAAAPASGTDVNEAAARAS